MAVKKSASAASRTTEQKLLLEQLQQVADGLARTFAPFCEVALHDLLDPEHALLALHNNLSGRETGLAATEMGLQRILDPDYPQVIANYAARFPDGRQAKSTSIGIKDSRGRYIAALCLNVDLTLFRNFQSALQQFSAVDAPGPALESIAPAGADLIRARIDAFAAGLATTPRALKAGDRRALVQQLKGRGLLDVRRAMEIIAAHIGVSRATVYSDAR